MTTIYHDPMRPEHACCSITVGELKTILANYAKAGYKKLTYQLRCPTCKQRWISQIGGKPRTFDQAPVK